MSNELATQNGHQELDNRAQRVKGIHNERGLQLATMQDMIDFCDIVAKSGLAPKGLETAPKLFIAVAMGQEVGLSPMQSIQNIAPINGRPAIWGSAQLGLVQGSGLLEVIDEWFEDSAGNKKDVLERSAKDDDCAVCFTRRKGGQEKTTRFSVKMAKEGGLWAKAGTWQTSPGRMMQFRARGFNLADQFPDVLKGMKSVEEQIGDEPIKSDVDIKAADLNGKIQAKLAAAKAMPDAMATAQPVEVEVEVENEPSEPMVTPEQQEQIETLLSEVYPDDTQKALVNLIGAGGWETVTESDAAQYIAQLNSELAQILDAAAA